MLTAGQRTQPQHLPTIFIAGITPLITNSVGQFVQAAPQESTMVTESSRMATLNAVKTHIHDHQKISDVYKDVQVAFPNDRAASIRPSDRKAQYRYCRFIQLCRLKNNVIVKNVMAL